VEALLAMAVLVAPLALLGLLAHLFGYDSRDGVDSDEYQRRQDWWWGRRAHG
jgi:hypothetical protein